MATTTQTDNRTKFLELRKQGVSAEDARNQTYGPAPVVPDATHIPVTPTSQINQDQLAKNQANRQAQIATGEIPAVGQQPAPVTPIAPAPTTTPSGATMNADGTVTAPTVTPVAQVTPTPTTKQDATPGITQDAFQQANIESEKIKAQNEAQMKLNTQQAQLKEQERQNVAKETAIANTPTDTQGILSSLVAGVPIAPQKTGNYINAKFQYDQYSKFNAMTPTQMLDNLKQGQIGTEMDKLLSQNPNYIQAKTELDKIQKTNNSNNNIKNIYGGVKGTTTETPDYLSMVSNELMTKLGLDKDMTSAEAFAQYVTGDQKIVDYTNQLSNTNRQIADTSKLINDGIKELKARKGDMPADALVVLLNSTFRDVNETLTNLNNTKTYLEADLKNASEMAFNRFNAVSKDIDNARTIKNSVISNLIQSQFSLANKMQENELANQIAKEAMNDPYKAIPSMIEEYKKLGIPFTRSTQQVIQDFETSGQDLSTYLSDLQKTIQAKPEYQKIKELQMGQLSDAQKMSLGYQQDINKMAISNQYDIKRMGLEQDFQIAMAQAKNVTSNKWTKLDDGMYTNEAGEIITADELKSAKLMGNSYITKQVGEEGGECGFYASRGTGMSATPGGNSKEARVKAFSDKTPEIGGMAFFGGAGYDPTYGHISIVTGVNADGTINVKESNYSGTGKVTERTVPASQVTGYYNNTPLAKGVSQPTGTQGEYNESDIELLSELANMDASARNTALKASGKTLKDVTDYMAQAKSGKIPATSTQKQSATQIMSSIQDLASMDWNDATGANFSMMDTAPAGSDWATAESKINNLVASITLPNLGMLKGPMSDKDLAFIQNASSKLSMKQRDAEFEKQLVELYNIGARKTGIAEIKKLKDIPKNRILPGMASTGSEQIATQDLVELQKLLNP